MALRFLYQGIRKIIVRIELLFKDFETKINNKNSKRNFIWLSVAIILILTALFLFIHFQDDDRLIQKYGVPKDDGVLTVHTIVHPNSPLYKGVEAFQKGYIYKSIDLFKKALSKDLQKAEKIKINNYLAYLYLSLKKYSDAEVYFRKSIDIDENAPGYFGIGRINHFKNNLNAAKKYYLKALDIEPKFKKSFHRLGTIFFNYKDYKKAGYYYLKYLKIDDKPYIRYLYGNSLFMDNKKSEALSQFRFVLDNATKKILLAYASARLGDIHDENNKIKKAIKYYKQAVMSFPQKKEFNYNLGVMYLKNGNLNRAIYYFRNALISSSGDERLLLSRTLGELYYDKKDYDKAIYYLKEAAKDGKNLDIIAVLADLHYIRKNYQKALNYYRKVIAYFPKSEVSKIAMINIGNIHMLRLQYDQALEYYNNAKKQDKNNSILLYNIGVVYSRKGLYEKAAKNFIKAYSINPLYDKALKSSENAYLSAGKPLKALKLYLNIIDKSTRPSPYLYSRTARIYYMAGENNKAVEYYRMALSREKKSSKLLEIYYGLARVYLDLKQNTKAYAVLRKAFKLKPDSPMCYYLYGLVYLAEKKYYRAEEAFRNALNWHPWDKLKTEVLYNIGNLIYKKGDYKKALDYFKQVLQIEPGHFAASYNASRCVKLLSSGGE